MPDRRSSIAMSSRSIKIQYTKNDGEIDLWKIATKAPIPDCETSNRQTYRGWISRSQSI